MLAVALAMSAVERYPRQVGRLVGMLPFFAEERSSAVKAGMAIDPYEQGGPETGKVGACGVAGETSVRSVNPVFKDADLLYQGAESRCVIADDARSAHCIVIGFQAS